MDDRKLLESRTDDIERDVARIADEFRAGFERVAQIDNRPSLCSALRASTKIIRPTQRRARQHVASANAAGQ
jgi:hypothetical protein